MEAGVTLSKANKEKKVRKRGVRNVETQGRWGGERVEWYNIVSLETFENV